MGLEQKKESIARAREKHNQAARLRKLRRRLYRVVRRVHGMRYAIQKKKVSIEKLKAEYERWHRNEVRSWHVKYNIIASEIRKARIFNKILKREIHRTRLEAKR